MVRPISSRFKEAIPTSRDHVVHRLGGERMGPYVHAAGGHYKTALALYRWNMTISAAFLELLSVTEVLARNALDEHLRVWCRRQGGNVEWLLHPDRIPTPLDKLFGSVAAGAYDKAQRAKEVRDKSATHARHQLPLTNGDILSQVTFGQWHTLFPWQEAEKLTKQQTATARQYGKPRRRTRSPSAPILTESIGCYTGSLTSAIESHTTNASSMVI